MMAIRAESDMHERRKSRNKGVLIALTAFVVLMFTVTIVKLGPDARNPSTDVSWAERLKVWLSE